MMGCELEHWEHGPEAQLRPAKSQESQQPLDFLDHHFAQEHLEAGEEESLEQEDERFNYLRLDTIEEEEDDESDDDLQPAISRQQRCQAIDTTTTASGPPRPQAEPRARKRMLPGSGLGHRQSADELARQPEQLVNESATSTGEPAEKPRDGTAQQVRAWQSAQHNNTINKCDNDNHNMVPQNKNSPLRSQSQQQQPQQQPLPSTNRLISEHQARQQQALFRALAERQKMLDELSGTGWQHLDLMSSVAEGRTGPASAGHSQASVGRSRRRRRAGRHRRQREPQSREAAVPLSSVDLSQMSDGMLDELLGQIASASSSSLSSNGESIDSSDQSPGYTSTSDNSDDEDDDDSSGLSDNGDRMEKRRRRRLQLEDAPNVVGIHEDERAGQAGRRQANCREAHRRAREPNRRDRDEDESDPRSEHELAIEPDSGVGSGGVDSSVAVAAGGDRLSPSEDQEPSQSRATPLTPLQAVANSQLEQYFTSGLVRPHQFQGDCHDLDSADASAPDASVEEVLARMLDSLNDIGPNDQERLNELLEAGFAHLEQLLNCNLAPSSSSSSASPAGQPRWQQPGSGSKLAQKLLANQQQAGGSQTLLSKDSDYGSDTQSADCLSHEPPVLSAPGDSPQQVAAATMKQQQQQQQQQRGLQLGSVAGAQQLSPLAVELSFKLAESLQRLAQQQQAHSRRPTQPVAGGHSNELQQPPTGTARRAPMKSVVLLNATPSSGSGASRPSSSLSGGSGAESARNWTPVGESQAVQQVSAVAKTTTTAAAMSQQQQAARPNFTTRVNLVSGEVSSVVVARSASQAAAGSPRRAPVAGDYCDDEEDYDDRQAASSPASRNSEDPEDPHEVASAPASAPASAASGGAGQWKRQAPASDLKRQESRQQVVRQQQQPKQQLEPQPPAPLANGGQPQPQPQQQVAASKWRSPRSSMRRKPATGSFGKPGGHLRPGSPLPRLQLEEQLAAAAAAAASQPGDGSSGGQPSATGQRQLQRALILAQKYNYSPAKLAASKLSHKLQLKNLQHPSPTTESNTAINVCAGSPNRITGHKERMEDCSASSGRIQLDVSYFAKSGSLTVHVIQCLGLAPANKRRNTSNPYIKLYLLPDRSKSAKRKSSVHRNELEPKFDERFTFGPLKLAEFEERSLWLSVCHKDRLGRNEVLGELLLPLVQVRHFLLTSDLCQSTGAKWYELLGSSGGSRHQQQPTTTGSLLSGSKEPLSSNKPLLKQQQQQQQQPPAHQHANPASDVRDSSQTTVARHSDELKAAGAPVLLPAPGSGINAHLKQAAPAPPSANQAPITGQLFVALKFVLDQHSSSTGKAGRANPNGELHVMIKEAHNISGYVPALATTASADHQHQHQPQHQVPPPSGSLPNPFCKCYLLSCTGQRLSKQKTPHLKRTVNPRWDHKCVFGSLRLANLSNQAIEIQMYNRDSVLVSREYLGGIRLCGLGGASQPSPATQSSGADTHTPASDSVSIASSSQSAGDGSSLRRSLNHLQRDSSSNRSLDADSAALCSERESRLWNQMLARPNIWVYGELTLRYLHPLIPKST